MQLSNIKQPTVFEMDKRFEQMFTKENVQMAKKHMKQWPALLVIKEEQILKMSYFSMPTRIAKISELSTWPYHVLMKMWSN